MNLLQRTAALTAAAAALVAGSSVAADAATGRHAVAIHTTSTHSVSAPSTLAPGLVRLSNTGTHAIYVFKRLSSSTDRLVRDLNASVNSSGPGLLIKDFLLLDGIEGRTSAYLPLGRGTYYLADAELGHYKRAEIRTVTVTGAVHNAVAPTATRVLVDSRNVLSVAHTVRQRYLHVVNANARLQEVMVFAIGSGTSAAQENAFLAHPSFDKLSGLDLRGFRMVGLLAGHHSLYASFSASPGRYLVMTVPFTSHTTNATLSSNRVRGVLVS